MQLPTYSEIARDPQQLSVYETPANESLFVAGPPGSGKTVLAIARAHTVANQGQAAVLVTFSRMLRRLVTTSTTDQPVETSTMHQFVTQHYKKQAGGTPLKVKGDRYSFAWDTMFERLDSKGVKPSDLHVIVDEGQDLPAGFFRYLRDYVASSITVFADEYQAIEENFSTLSTIKQAAGLKDPVLLRFNHRNTPEIADVAQHFHAGNLPTPDVIRDSVGEIPQLLAHSQAKSIEMIANWYQTRGQRIGVSVVRNATGQSLFNRLKDRLGAQRVQIYKHNLRNEDDIDLERPGITILNVRSIKGQEFETMFITELDKLLLEMSEVNRREMFMLCSRARDYLFLIHTGQSIPQQISDQCPTQELLIRS